MHDSGGYEMITPLRGLALVRPIKSEEKSYGGIILTESSEKMSKGTVIAVGLGNLTLTGDSSPAPVVSNDVVFYRKYSGEDIADGPEKLSLIRFEDLLAIES